MSLTTTDAPPSADWLAGRALLEHHARTGRVFTANQIRGELRALGFSRFSTGMLFLTAKADGIIRKVGFEVSTDAPTHGAVVRQWIGTQARGLDVLVPRGEAVTVNVNRDQRGQFARANDAAPAGPSLLDYLEES